jgi:serine/threonine protein kinase/tetratricopeptide (TPR) repeat protein
MDCPHCHTNNPPAAERCSSCDTPLTGNASTLVGTMTPPNVTPATPPELSGPTVIQGSPIGEATMLDTPGVASGWSKPLSTSAGIVVAGTISALRPGAVLGKRYEIQDQLGEGGMGAVYKAKDLELERVVALKVIRPELAGRPEILQRFKQELILARKITHRNVIRIFDLGESEGIKYITMEFIEGRDLKSLMLEQGKLSSEQAVNIIQQMCLALEAAHSEGVVHRDLKPQNVMLDKQGKASVMDFGIARSLEPGGMTQTGALIGTPEYMSPEQVRGEHPDVRSDLFTVGIIFYELLSGQMPYRADTAMATMFKRTKEPAMPVRQLNSSVPQYLSDVVAKCLEMEPAERYQSAREIYDALEAWKSGATSSAGVRALRWTRKLARRKLVMGSLAAAIVLVTLSIVFRGRLSFTPSNRPPAAVEVRSLAILPFRNASGDPSLDQLGSSLAAMLTTDVGQSSHFRAVSPDRVDQILRDLRIEASRDLDPATMKRISEFSNADMLISGQFNKIGEQYRIDVVLRDSKRAVPVNLKVEAAGEKELLDAISQLAKSVQQNLSLSSDVLKELRVKTVAPSSQSIQALKAYTEGLQLARQANNAEAVSRFTAAIQADPKFALAHAMLALSYSKLGGQENDDRALEEARQGLTLSDNLPVEERYRIQAVYAQITGDGAKAQEAYENLAKAFPADSDVHFTLGGLYEGDGALDRAQEQFLQVLRLDPKNLEALIATGRVRIKSGKPQESLEDLNRALSLSVELGNDRAKANVLHALGVAYRQLNKLDEALRNFDESVALKRRLSDKRGTALSLNEIAKVDRRMGRIDAALKGFNEALAIRRAIGDKKGVSDTLLDLGVFQDDQGHVDDALKLYKEALQIKRELGDDAGQATLLNNIGGCYLAKAQYDDAAVYYENALQLREKLKVPGDIADTLYNLGETSRSVGEYDKALDRYLRALEIFRNNGDKLRTAITADATGSVFANRGRFGAALASKQDALKAIREVQEGGFWLAQIVSSYGDSLSQMGRYDEAGKSLNEALQAARQLQNKTIIAQTLISQGDSFFYQDQFESAEALYQQALAAASGTTDRRLILLAKRNLARVAVKRGKASAAVGELRAVVAEADKRGLKFLSTETSLDLAEALSQTKNYADAQKIASSALRTSERLGLQSLQARAEHLLARIALYTGRAADVTRALTEARRIVADIYKEANSDTIRKRKDLEAYTSEIK